MSDVRLHNYRGQIKKCQSKMCVLSVLGDLVAFKKATERTVTLNYMRKCSQVNS